MNSVKIGTYQMDTAFGLYLPEYTIPAPAPQTKFVKIIGRDGSVDLSDAIGLHYDSRSWSLDFKCFDPTVNWHTLTSSVMNAIHGKRLNFEFDDDPDYFWTGRISVSSYVSTRGTGTLKVNITSDPFKYAKLSTIVTKTASTGTEYTGSMVTFNGGLVYDLSADIEPIQDLHGYSSPWPAGGGKNLLKTAGLIEGTPSDTTFGNATKRTFTVGTFVTKLSNNNYYNSGANIQFSLSENLIKVTSSARAYAISIPIVGLTIGEKYVLSCTKTNASNNTASFYKQDGTFISATPSLTVCTFTVPEETYYTLLHFNPSANDVEATFTDIQLEKGSVPTSYAPYANICPISGLTGLSVYVSPTQDPDDATVYNVDWTTQAGTVYGGTVNVVTGVLTVDMVNIPSYNGETINEPWLSSMDAYAAGTTPTIGAQVVYTLATPLTYQLTPQEVEALVGTNNIWTSSGNVSVTVVTPETVTNNGLPIVPTVTASADMVLRWGNYSASVQQGTSTIPQLVLETGDNKICIIGTGNISFEWSEASL